MRQSRSPRSTARLVEFNDIGKQDRREHPIWVGFAMLAGQKLFERADNLIGDLAFADEAVVFAWQL